MSYVSPTEGWAAPTEMSGVAAVDRGEVISSRPAQHQLRSEYTAQSRGMSAIEDPYVPDEFFGPEEDDEGWEALRDSSNLPVKKSAGLQWEGHQMHAQQVSHRHEPQQQQQTQAATPVCFCAEACVQLTANTAANPGRQFFKCAKPRDDPSACKYFKWVDELDKASPGHAPQNFSQNLSQSQGKYTPGFAYGAGAGAPAPHMAGKINLQAAADGEALRDRSNDQCYKCGQTGHWSTQCPNMQRGTGPNAAAGLGTQGGNDVCYKCNQPGHWSRDCTNQNAGGSKSVNPAVGGGATGTCFKCGQPGHWSRDCPNQRATQPGVEFGGSGGNYGGGGMVKTSTCYKCGEEGHWSRDCPNQGGGAGGAKRKFESGNSNYRGTDGYGYGGRGNKGGRGASAGDSACFKCGQHGHWTRDCPNR